MRIMMLTVIMGLILSVACDSNPDERTLISEPRLLAIRSSPSALSGLDGAVNLSALAIGGDGQLLPNAEIRYRVCSPWEFLIDPEQDCPATSALTLTGTALTAQEILAFYPPPPSVGETGQPPDGPDSVCAAQGLIEVPIIAELQIEEFSLLTVKRIPFYFRQVVRQNPKIGNIEIASQPDGEYTLSIDIDPNSLDSECRDEVEVLEAIRIYLYSTSGSFEDSSVDVVPTRGGAIEAAEVVWTSSEPTATLFFVALDNEGGVDWQILSI